MPKCSVRWSADRLEVDHPHDGKHCLQNRLPSILATQARLEPADWPDQQPGVSYIMHIGYRVGTAF